MGEFLDKKEHNGGVARARSLSPEERKEIATKAAHARWNSDAPDITHTGELVLADLKIPCYVTIDGQRLISGRGMQEALRLVDEDLPESGQKPGSRMTRLLNNKKLKPLFFKDKRQDHFLPVKCKFQGKIIHGYNGEMLADLCEGMLEARSQGILLSPRQQIIATQCEILLRAFARVGITALIDEATGYQGVRPKDALKKYIEKIIRKDLAAWVKRFPDEFYENIYKLKGWEWTGMGKNRFSVVAYYTRDLIYQRLAPGVLTELENRSPKNEKGQRENKFHQWLSDDIGHPMLSQHFFATLAIQRACLNKSGDKWKSFKRMMDDILPKKGDTLLLPLGESDVPDQQGKLF
jgi:hypothetical protein